MLKKILMGLGALVVLVIGVVLYRTFTYGGAPVGDRVELPDVPAISAEKAADHLAEAIRFTTITLANGDPRPGQEGPWLALHDWLETTYPAAHAAMTREIVPGTLTLLYTWQGSDPSLKPILLMAHQDVVPVNMGTEGDWTGAPFKGDIIDGYVYGRGALDDKGNLVGIMEAVDALAASGFQPKRTILVQFGHDEEVLGSGAKAGIALLTPQAALAPVMQARLNRLVEIRVRLLRRFTSALGRDTPLTNDEMELRLKNLFRNRVSFFWWKFLMKSALNLMNAAAPLGVIVVGGWMVILGESTLGVVIAFVGGFSRLGDPIRQLISFYREAAQAEIRHAMVARWMKDGPGGI